MSIHAGAVMPNDKQFQMRVSDEFLSIIDGWRRLQPDLPPRAEAVRRLVNFGVEASLTLSPTESSDRQLLLAKFREFVAATLTDDFKDGIDLDIAARIAKAMANLSDGEIETALTMTVRQLVRRVAQLQEKSGKAKPKKATSERV
ncbi:hypothetical protein [Rhodoblastus acidophilus]|uniref:hypothetical protein n=1 Tax=Rhodoblastus acidophilus TaxID=1074 RepID=UPI0011308096|nr:hypothetical protein [Rhodoblastus acidophilus]